MWLPCPQPVPSPCPPLPCLPYPAHSLPATMSLPLGRRRSFLPYVLTCGPREERQRRRRHVVSPPGRTLPSSPPTTGGGAFPLLTYPLPALPLPLPIACHHFLCLPPCLLFTQHLLLGPGSPPFLGQGGLAGLLPFIVDLGELPLFMPCSGGPFLCLEIFILCPLPRYGLVVVVTFLPAFDILPCLPVPTHLALPYLVHVCEAYLHNALPYLVFTLSAFGLVQFQVPHIYTCPLPLPGMGQGVGGSAVPCLPFILVCAPHLLPASSCPHPHLP